MTHSCAIIDLLWRIYAFQVSFHSPIGISYQHDSIRDKIYFSPHDIIKAFNFRVIEIYGLNRFYITTINLGTILLKVPSFTYQFSHIPPTPSLQLLRSNCTLPSTVPWSQINLERFTAHIPS